MLKVMGQLHRRPDLPLDAFRLHWRTVHRGLALRLAHAGLLRGYVQNHRLDIAVDGLEAIADGVPELWFDDAESFARMRAADVLRKGAFQDEPNFMDTGNYRSLLLDEESIALAPSRRECAGLLKAMVFLGPETVEAADPTVSLLGHGRPVRLSVHRRSVSEAGVATSGHSLVETSWWASLDHFCAAWSARRSPQSVEGMLVEERPVFWPGETPPPADWTPVAQRRS